MAVEQAPLADAGAPAQGDPSQVDPQKIKYENLLTALNYATSVGNAGFAKYLQGGINRLGGQLGQAGTAGISGVNFADPNFDELKAEGAKTQLDLYKQSKGEAPNSTHAGVFNTRVGQLRNQAQGAQSQQEWSKYGDPAFDSAQAGIDDLTSHPALSAGFLADQRSQIAATIKGSEQQRLKQVFAGLGMAGGDMSSPANAALVHQSMLDSDAELAKTLSEYGLDAETINRSNLEHDLSLKTDLATRRLSAKSAFLSGDKDRMYQLSEQISTVLESIRAQKELMAYQNAQARDSQNFQRNGMYLQGSFDLANSAISSFGGGAKKAG